MSDGYRNVDFIPSKGKGKKILLFLGPGGISLIFIIFLVVILGSGVFASFSMVGGFLNAITGKNDLEALREQAGILNDLTAEEVLELVVADKIDDSFYETMMISKEEFEYLLKEVIADNWWQWLDWDTRRQCVISKPQYTFRARLCKKYNLKLKRI